jgi:transcriptional regulator with XRE-family HTH domain
MNEVSDRVARRVRALRQQRGWSVRQLADECAKHDAPQLTVASLGNIERGQDADAKRRAREVTVDELYALAAVFGVAPDALAGPDGQCEVCDGSPPAGFMCLSCGRTTKHLIGEPLP